MRTDLLALGDDALADLTNRGTARRARREIDEARVVSAITETESGLVVVEADDGTRCELTAGGFDSWLCTCLAAQNCRHLVRAVMAYREWAPRRATEGDPSAAPPSGHTPNGDPFGPVSLPASLWPGDISDEALAATLSPQRLARAHALAADGVLAHVAPGDGAAISVIRLHHPVPVTVRFLIAGDLGYARCDCDEAPPCLHLALAVWSARGKPADPAHRLQDSRAGLYSVDAGWRPDARLLRDVEALLLDLLAVGASTGHRVLGAVLSRTWHRCDDAGLHSLAGCLKELAANLARYAESDAQFSGEDLVDVLAESFARVRSLSSPASGRAPDRLVAGTASARDFTLEAARLVGVGTEIIERDGVCVLRALLLDTRSGSACAVVRERVDDPTQPTPAGKLARALVNGIALSTWGSGQVLLQRGTRNGLGVLSPGRRASVLPGGDLTAIGPPHVARTLAELKRQQTGLPRVLDARSVATGLGVVPLNRAGPAQFDPVVQKLQAPMRDADGASATLSMPWTTRSAAGVDALAALLARVGQDTVWVSGRWRWTPAGAIVTPLLVVNGHDRVQPHVAGASEDTDATFGGIPSESLTPEGAVLLALRSYLGGLLLAGTDRRAEFAAASAELAEECERVGAIRMAALVRVVDQPPSSGRPSGQSVVELLLVVGMGTHLAAA